MLPRVKELKKLPQLEEPKKIRVPNRPGKKREPLKRICINSDYSECRQAIPLPDGVYCGMWREKVSPALCESCPYFDREPLEYRLFRRE